MKRDHVFLIVIAGLFAIMILFGAAMLVLSLEHEPSDKVTFRVLSALGGMFGATVGLILGYLVGKRNGNGQA